MVLQISKWGEATFENESSKVRPVLWFGKPPQGVLRTQSNVIGPRLISGTHPHSAPPSPTIQDLLETRLVMLTTEVVSQSCSGDNVSLRLSFNKNTYNYGIAYQATKNSFTTKLILISWLLWLQWKRRHWTLVKKYDL